LGRLQDGVFGRSGPGRERLAEVSVAGIFGREGEALAFGERAGERAVGGGEVFDPLADLADLADLAGRLVRGRGELGALGGAGGRGFG